MKDFRTRMVKNYVRPGLEPFDNYNISPDVWEEFRQQKMRPEWEV